MASISSIDQGNGYGGGLAAASSATNQGSHEVFGAMMNGAAAPQGFHGASPPDAQGASGGVLHMMQELMQMMQQVLQTMQGGQGASAQGVTPGGTSGGAPSRASADNVPPNNAPPGGAGPGAPAQNTGAQASAKGAGGGAGPGAPAQSTAAPSTSAGTGPNSIEITNKEDHPITVGKFKNGESTTDPSAQITLQPGQTGKLNYENGESGYAAQADASGKFQPNASRLEYEADKDGKMKYPDISYIDGRNASISLTDGAGLNKGDGKSIAGSAPAGTVSADAAGNKTVAGWYDGSTARMQAGGKFMQDQLGTSGAYLHPNDDTLQKDQNPMSGTQSSTLKASFGNA